MSEEVIRQDIIELSIDTDLKEFKKLTKEIDELKKDLKGGVGEEKFEDLNDFAKQATKGTDGLRDSVKKLAKTSLTGLHSGLKKVATQLSTISKKAVGAALTGLKKLAGISFKALAVGATAAATAIGAIVTKAVSAYAEYEQLIGGVETLFGKSASIVEKNANNAFKTAGLSANQYMETVTSFSASLIQSLGGDTKKVAEYADMAIIDMSDNANKMGTDMSMIQNAYQGFAKQNYTMLDNLKLGYGGTKTEMQRLVKDAAKLDKSVKKNDMSFGNIVKAIHAVQVNMGIAGATTAEAEGTITGSLASVKASWNNLMPALIQGGDTFDQCLDNFVESATKFGENMLPTIEKALYGVGKLIDAVVPIIEKKLPSLIETLLPPLIRAAVSLTAGLIKALPTIVKSIAKEIPNAAKILWDAVLDTFGDQLPILNKITNFFKKNGGSISNFFKKSGDAIVKFMPILLGLFGAFKLFKKVKSFASIFGGKKLKASGNSGGLFGGITNAFKSLAKVKTTTILKGMGNLAIILVGFGVLAYAFAAVAPQIAELSNTQSLVELAAIMFVLGALGSALAGFAGAVGKIPFPTILSGLGGIATVIVGAGVLVAAFGALAQIDGIQEFMEQGGDLLASLFGTIGECVGSIISGVGEGLTNSLPQIGENISSFATSLQPMFDVFGNSNIDTAGIGNFLTSFGSFMLQLAGQEILSFLTGDSDFSLLGQQLNEFALSSYTAFCNFAQFPDEGIAKAPRILDALGGIGGYEFKSGGVAQFFTGEVSLRDIGEQLSAFSVSSYAAFCNFAQFPEEGITKAPRILEALGGIGGYEFKSGGVAQFFTGEVNLGEIGRQLSLFAKTAYVAFNIFAKYPEEGITKAPKILESIDAVGKYDFKSGGVAQFFSGDVDLGGVGKQLVSFAKSAYIAYAVFAKYPEQGITNAPKILESMDAIGKYDFKSGGIAQLFTGEVDLSHIGSELYNFSWYAYPAFCNFAQFPDEGIKKAPRIFDALGGIGDYDFKSGGLAQLFTGTVNLENIGTQLDKFAHSTQSAFNAFSEYPEKGFENFDSVIERLKGLDGVTETAFDTSGLDNFSKGVENLVKQVKDLPKQMGDGLRSASEELSTALVDIWKDAVKASIAPVNKLLSGANHILKEFGSEKRVIEWQPYAKGTDGHKGGNALVNDGRGAELVQMPNGNTFIPKGRNVLIPNAPKGMKVLPAESTAQVMGKGSPTFSYAEGTGNLDIWSYIDNASGLVSKISENIKYSEMNGFVLNAGKGMVSTFASAMGDWVEKLFEESGQSIGDYVPSKGVSQWRSTVARALKMEGQYSLTNVARTLFQMQTESGGNPRAINLWDSNAKKGIPSKGLMQVIDPTFNAYARSGYNKDIYDPLSNILASIRYAVSRYGSLARAYRGKGYANGGIATTASIFGENGAEMAIPLSRSKRKRGLELWAETGEIFGLYSPESDNGYHSTTYAESNTYAPHFELHISGTSDDRAMARKVKKWVVEAWEDMLDSFDSKNPQTQEI